MLCEEPYGVVSEHAVRPTAVGDLWVPESRLPYAACEYSPTRPPRRSRRTTPPTDQGNRRLGRSERRCLRQRTVWTVRVVMADVLGHHRLQVAPSEDQHPVKQLPPHCADPALRVRVGPRRPHRRLEHLDASGGEDRVPQRSKQGSPQGGDLRKPYVVGTADLNPRPLDPQATSRARWPASRPLLSCRNNPYASMRVRPHPPPSSLSHPPRFVGAPTTHPTHAVARSPMIYRRRSWLEMRWCRPLSRLPRKG